jgi:hypothetical protein
LLLIKNNFEEEESEFLSKEGKWSSSPACSVVLYNCMLIKFTFIVVIS